MPKLPIKVRKERPKKERERGCGWSIILADEKASGQPDDSERPPAITYTLTTRTQRTFGCATAKGEEKQFCDAALNNPSTVLKCKKSHFR